MRRNSFLLSSISFLLIAAVIAFGRSDVAAQRGAGGQRGAGPAAAPQTARTRGPIDFTGTWVSVVTEDWRWRMVTPPKDPTAAASIPVNQEARRVAQAWDLEADNKGGNQCRAFGVGGINRQPGRLRISWQDDNTLKFEYDAGTQTRLLYFDRAAQPPAEKTWQGFSRADWEGPGVGRGAAPVGDNRVTGGGLPGAAGVPGGGGQGLRGGPPPRGQARINTGANLKIVTTNFREGYLRKNGIPYSEQAVVTEYIHRLPTHPNGDNWLQLITIVEDPRYLTQPYYTSTNFRLEPNDTNFRPTPCQTAPPLPVKMPSK
ncbi:MAG TPA: hypothetical protein VM819_21895 [Vicinamibacterales bacterium]|nr:hypothetical protein [Vicinamibacterales bacterium]